MTSIFEFVSMTRFKMVIPAKKPRKTFRGFDSRLNKIRD